MVRISKAQKITCMIIDNIVILCSPVKQIASIHIHYTALIILYSARSMDHTVDRRYTYETIVRFRSICEDKISFQIILRQKYPFHIRAEKSL